MKFAREGYFAAAVPAAAALLVWAGFGAAWAAPPASLALAVLLFFRDPERTPEGGDDALISPADGKVVAVETLPKGHPMAPEACHRICVFMSPLDVHINRIPAAGTVLATEHRAGKFKAAYSEEASEVNEAQSLLLETDAGFKMVVVQIAGWLARRIVCHVDGGTHLVQGQRYGLIMFGSRVDVYLPDGVRPTVSPGQRVWSGASVIARRGEVQ